MKIERLNSRKWQYKINDKYYDIIISDELEHFLNKPQHTPVFQNGVGIISLNNIPIELACTPKFGHGLPFNSAMS